MPLTMHAPTLISSDSMHGHDSSSSPEDMMLRGQACLKGSTHSAPLKTHRNWMLSKIQRTSWMLCRHHPAASKVHPRQCHACSQGRVRAVPRAGHCLQQIGRSNRQGRQRARPDLPGGKLSASKAGMQACSSYQRPLRRTAALYWLTFGGLY